MKRLFLLCLSCLLLLVACAPEESPSDPTATLSNGPYLSFPTLDIVIEQGNYVLTTTEGGRVEFSSEGELLEAVGITPVNTKDGYFFPDEEGLTAAFGAPHCDIGSGLYRPTYITESACLLTYSLVDGKVESLTTTEILTGESFTSYSVSALEFDGAVIIEDGSVTYGASDMAMFALQTGGGGYLLPGVNASLTITLCYGSDTYTSQLSYADGVYTLTDGEEQRSYPYLIYDSETLPDGANSDFAEYYLLSDDPEMTIERYHQYLISAILQTDFPRTEIIYTDYLRFERTETYGEAPIKYAHGENLSLLVGARFCEDGFYREQLLTEPDPADSGLTETVRRCYSYDFTPLPDNSLPESEGWGYYRGETVAQYTDLLSPAELEEKRRPNDPDGELFAMEPLGIWQEGEGYILLRLHRLDIWKLQNPVISRVSYCCELILTCYDENHQPQWQTVSDIFVY